jgi:hypothetical protein
MPCFCQYSLAVINMFGSADGSGPAHGTRVRGSLAKPRRVAALAATRPGTLAHVAGPFCKSAQDLRLDARVAVYLRSSLLVLLDVVCSTMLCDANHSFGIMPQIAARPED